MSYINVKNLYVGYDKKPVAGPIDFKVSKGDYLCILGENGAGKSTLMKTLLGLNAPVSGEITRGDTLNENEIGYLPQQTETQMDFPATVREIVVSGRLGKRKAPFYKKEDKEIAAENMKKMGVLELAGKSYRYLSGGQKQRVLLARALCAAQKVLLLDEPVSGLDPKATAEMYDLIKTLNSEGISIIMISHDVHEAIKDATHILYVGKDVFYGTKRDYLETIGKGIEKGELE